MEIIEMTDQVTITGIIVNKDPNSVFESLPNDGLYLLTEDQKLITLITSFMAAQMPVEHLHRQSRSDFESYIGKKVSVSGYLSGSTLWSAVIIEPEGE